MRPSTIAAAALCLIITASSNADDRVELHTGDVLTGSVIEQTDEHIVIDHPVFGAITVPRADIASLTIAGEPALEALPTEDVEPETPRWESQFDLGFGGSRGNTRTLDFRTAFRTQLETDLDRWRLDASYLYGRSEGSTNKNQGTAGILKDWLMPDSPWLFFAQGRYDFDRFRSWTHRASGHGGVGYEFIKTDELTLIGRAGAGAAKEWRPSDSIRPEGLLGGELLWRINDQQRLTAHTTLYPDLGDFFEFRVVSGVRWDMAIDHARGLSLHLGVDNEYESSPGEGVRHNDLKFFGGLSLVF